MPRDKTASHIRIMAAAREEFMEHGRTGGIHGVWLRESIHAAHR